MPMPITAMDEDAPSASSIRDIRRARQVAVVYAVAVTEPMNDLADDEFGPRASLPNARHANRGSLVHDDLMAVDRFRFGASGALSHRDGGLASSL
jgi:hypothetical protein